MRLIDADKTIKELKRQRDQYEAHDWINLKESLISDGYDFAITDVDHMPTVEAIPKADYELLSTSITMMKADYNARLKADMVAMLTELSVKIGEIEDGYTEFDEENKRSLTMIPLESVERLIDGEINSLKGETE